MVEILYQLGKRSYGVAISTISDIKRKESEIRSYKRKATAFRRALKNVIVGRDQEL